MNLRLSILLVVVLLLFGGTFLVVRLTGSEERPELNPWLYRIDEGSIVHIEVAHEGEIVTYDRAPGSIDWVIQGDPEFPVFNQRWAGTPLLLSGPRVNRPLAEEIDDPALYGLGPPLTEVRVTDSTGNTVVFHLGIPTPDAQNQYARLVGSPGLYTVPAVWADVVNRLALDPPFGQLYELDPASVRVVEVSNPDDVSTFFLNETAGQWVLDGELPLPVTSDAWFKALDILAGPRVDKLLAHRVENPEELGFEPPQTRVYIARQGGAPVEFHVGDLTPDGQYRYVRMISDNATELYAVLPSRLERIISLASDPPIETDSGG